MEAEEEERHKGSLTQKQKKNIIFLKKGCRVCGQVQKQSRFESLSRPSISDPNVWPEKWSKT
jgi:hypothetical protein